MGVFGNLLKKARVILFLKSGDKHLLTNYCLISMLSAFSKVFKKLFFTRLYNFFDKNSIFFQLNKVSGQTI